MRQNSSTITCWINENIGTVAHRGTIKVSLQRVRIIRIDENQEEIIQQEVYSQI